MSTTASANLNDFVDAFGDVELTTEELRKILVGLGFGAENAALTLQIMRSSAGGKLTLRQVCTWASKADALSPRVTPKDLGAKEDSFSPRGTCEARRETDDSLSPPPASRAEAKLPAAPLPARPPGDPGERRRPSVRFSEAPPSTFPSPCPSPVGGRPRGAAIGVSAPPPAEACAPFRGEPHSARYPPAPPPTRPHPLSAQSPARTVASVAAPKGDWGSASPAPPAARAVARESPPPPPGAPPPLPAGTGNAPAETPSRGAAEAQVRLDAIERLAASALLHLARLPVDASVRQSLNDGLVKIRQLAGGGGPAGSGAGDGSVEGTPPPQPPAMVPHAGAVTQAMRERQLREPQRWSLTLDQVLGVLRHCVATDEYARLRARDGRVSMYAICDHFVKPWCAGTGCGVSILLNPDVGAESELLLSHAWGGDVEEFLDALSTWRSQHYVPGSLRVWQFLFAAYHCEGVHGPTMATQNSLRPLSRLLESQALRRSRGGRGVLAVSTSAVDFCSRLWCVYEVERASAAEGVELAVAMSSAHTANIVQQVAFVLGLNGTYTSALEAAGVAVRSAQAICSQPTDRDALAREILRSQGQFAQVDTVVCSLFKRTLPDYVLRELVRAGMSLPPIDNFGKDLAVALLAVGNLGVSRLQEVGGALCEDPAVKLLVCRALASQEALDELAARLADDHSRAREAAADTIGRIAKQATHLAPLVGELLEDSVEGVRRAAVELFGKMGDRCPTSVAPLVAKRLADRRPTVRAAAAQALGQARQAAVAAAPEVIKLLTHEFSEVRRASAEFLATMSGLSNPQVAAPELIKRISDEHPTVCAAAAHALGQMGRPIVASATFDLVALLSHEVWGTRLAAVELIGHLGESMPDFAARELSKRLQDEDADVRRAAVAALDRAGQRVAAAVPELIELLTCRCWEARSAAADALGKLGEKAPVVAGLQLASRLADSDATVCAAATRALSRLPECAAAAGPQLVELLEHEAWTARRAAAEVLGSLGERAPARAARPLARMLLDTHRDVNEAAAEALAQMGGQADAAVPELLAHLHHETCAIRTAAAELLGRLGAAHAAELVIPELLARLADDTLPVRNAAATALTHFGQEDALLGELRAMLLSADAAIRCVSVELLGKFGDNPSTAAAAVRALLRGLTDPSQEVCSAAVLSLEHVGEAVTGVASELMVMLTHEACWARRAAAEALGKMRAKAPAAAASELLKRLADEDAAVRRAAAAALALLEEQTQAVALDLVELLSHEMADARRAAAALLGNLNEIPAEAAPALATCFKDEDAGVRGAAFLALEHMGESAVGAAPQLIELLAHRRSDVRRGAAQIFVQLGDFAPAEAAPVLARLLADNGSGVSDAASKALLRMGVRATSASEELVELLAHTFSGTRQAAVEMIGAWGESAPASAAPHLVKRLEDSNAAVVTAAAVALGAMGDQAAGVASELVDLLGRKHWRTRVAAAQALGKWGERAPPGSIAQLVRMLGDTNSEICNAGAAALAEMGAHAAAAVPQALSLLKDERWGTRRAAVELLGRLGEWVPAEAATEVAKRLADEDADVRLAAATALGQMGKHVDSVVPVLVQFLTHEAWGTFRAAAEFLAKLGDRAPVSAVPVLIKRLTHEDAYMCQAAAAALAQMGAQSINTAAPLLVEMLSAEAGATRRAAAEFLGALGEHMPKAAASALACRLADERADVSAAAAEALGRMSEDACAAAAPSLLALLTHEAWEVRVAAAEALGRMATFAPPDVAPGLACRLVDENEAARDAIAAALFPLLDAKPFGAGVLPPLLRGLRHGHSEVRVLHLRALGRAMDAAGAFAPALAGELAMRLDKTPEEIMRLVDGVCDGELDAARALSQPPREVRTSCQ